jgi:predicted enzyme related to lactoylglutathione lyase
MAILDANNVTVCMHEKAAGTKSSPGGAEARHYERHWTPVHIDLHVVDFDAVLGRVRQEGGTVELEFRNEGPKPAAFCSDPFGNGFCVIGDATSCRDPRRGLDARGEPGLQPSFGCHQALEAERSVGCPEKRGDDVGLRRQLHQFRQPGPLRRCARQLVRLGEPD